MSFTQVLWPGCYALGHVWPCMRRMWRWSAGPLSSNCHMCQQERTDQMLCMRELGTHWAHLLRAEKLRGRAPAHSGSLALPGLSDKMQQLSCPSRPRALVQHMAGQSSLFELHPPQQILRCVVRRCRGCSGWCGTGAPTGRSPSRRCGPPRPPARASPRPPSCSAAGRPLRRCWRPCSCCGTQVGFAAHSLTLRVSQVENM